MLNGSTELMIMSIVMICLFIDQEWEPVASRASIWYALFEKLKIYKASIKIGKRLWSNSDRLKSSEIVIVGDGVRLYKFLNLYLNVLLFYYYFDLYSHFSQKTKKEKKKKRVETQPNQISNLLNNQIICKLWFSMSFLIKKKKKKKLSFMNFKII